MAHVINRLQMEVSYADEAQAFNLRQNFAVTFQEQIAAIIDTVCSQYVKEDEWLRLDKLEIDLGHFTSYAFDTSFAVAFRNKFKRELTEQLSRISPGQKRASRQHSKAALFQYFLQKGTLPWWADAAPDINDIGIALFAQQPEAGSHFFYEHRFNANVWKRVAFQLNKETKSQIVVRIEELKNWKTAFVFWLQHALLLIKEAAGITSSFSEEKTNNVVISNAPHIFHQQQEESFFWTIAAQHADELFTENKTAVKEALLEHKALILKRKGEPTNYKNSEKANFFKKEEVQQKAAPFIMEEIIVQTQLTEDENEEEKYFVKHAGIVLLAFFLTPFFTNLHLLDDGDWISKDAQYKAIYLLKYLSTGQQNIPEYSLTFEKLICGIAIEEPIPIDVVLTEEETAEAEKLLHAVLEHWKSLKNTSVNGLREAFLKRDGILKSRENGWLLQVERKTLDVLIDSIPWGFSTIRFPWSPYLLFVEW